MAMRLEVPPEAVTPDPPGTTRNRRNKPGSWGLALKRDWRLYTLVLLPLAYFAVFRYLPMAGNVIAFGVEAHFHAPAMGRELQRVAQQVPHHLLDA